LDQSKSRKYYSKILLFGEYTTVIGSKALAMPYKRFSGEWSFKENNETQSELLLKFLDYALSINADVREKQFRSDIKNGLWFNCNIPIGYGLGSSGAFTAAFFDKYIIQENGFDTEQLRIVLADLESFFHGKSSGTDPLVSLLNMPIIIHEDKSIELLYSDYQVDWHRFELINSGQARSTEPLVKQFLDRLENNRIFKNKISILSTLNNEIIEACLNQDSNAYNTCLKAISHIQYYQMSDWIPDHIKDIWTADPNCVMKLCGAGGGGYFLKFWEQS
jgi:mevalonate kinase